MNKNITRVMIRLNMLMKIEDHDTKELYYAFIKSSKVWSDINFISVRVHILDGVSIPIDIKTKQIFHKTDLNFLEQKFQEIDQYLTNEKCIQLIEKELDKVFGIKDFDGVLIKDKIDYIEESKTVNEITYYHNRFFVITKIVDLNRIMSLKTIELISRELLRKLNNSKFLLHDRYAPSQLLKDFIKNELWKNDIEEPLRLEALKSKKRIGVLFSDLKDFGNLVKQFNSNEEPELTQLLIKKYQNLASLEIKSRGGYVVQTSGDSFMAIFQLTNDEINDIQNIMEAAINILAIKEISIDSRYPALSVKTRIGINVAEVEEGFLGALDLREYTVFGKDVNIASRLEKKVGELAEYIIGFSGGILFNIANSKADLEQTVDRKANEISEFLVEHAKSFSNRALKNRLIHFANSLKDNFQTDYLFELVKTLVLDSINQINQKTNQNIIINPNLEELSVKEGKTMCIFIYKSDSKITLEKKN